MNNTRSIWYADWLPFAILQVADFVTTGIGLTLGAVELNPMGLNPVIWLFKVVYTVAVCILIQHSPTPLLRQVVTTLFGLVVIWNCTQILIALI